MEHAVILSAVRTPIGKFMGGLASLTAPELGSASVVAVLGRADYWRCARRPRLFRPLRRIEVLSSSCSPSLPGAVCREDLRLLRATEQHPHPSATPISPRSRCLTR